MRTQRRFFKGFRHHRELQIGNTLVNARSIVAFLGISVVTGEPESAKPNQAGQFLTDGSDRAMDLSVGPRYPFSHEKR
jgi:hypothetical protein